MNKTNTKFECIRGFADKDNMNVIVMQGDIVNLDSVDEGWIECTGVAGFCEGFILSFTPRQFAENFKGIGINYTI
jgi:hypothetical protein